MKDLKLLASRIKEVFMTANTAELLCFIGFTGIFVMGMAFVFYAFIINIFS